MGGCGWSYQRDTRHRAVGPSEGFPRQPIDRPRQAQRTTSSHGWMEQERKREIRERLDV